MKIKAKFSGEMEMEFDMYDLMLSSLREAVIEHIRKNMSELMNCIVTLEE